MLVEMWKFVLLILIIAIANGCASPQHRRMISPKHMTVVDLIVSNGYPAQNITVETSDGYLLDLIRIPHGRNERHYQSGSSYKYGPKKQSSENNGHSYPEANRLPVLLVHGMKSNAEDFVLGGPSQGLAYILADNGFDVFLANTRGTTYGRKHAVLNPETDAAFWRFCWDDVGRKDLPTIIDKVLEVSKQRKLYYIGHMQGTTVFYVMASEKPEYNNKIHMMVSLGPVAFMSGTSNTMLNLISQHQQSKGWIVRHLGENEFTPSQELLNEGGEADCFAQNNNAELCKQVFFLLNGYNFNNVNMTTLRSVMERDQSGTSTQTILHYTQLIQNGHFAKYSPDGNKGQDYDLTKITSPVAFFSTSRDSISTMESVDKLASNLPNLVQSFKVDNFANNMELLYGNNVADTVYSNLLRIMRSIN